MTHYDVNVFELTDFNMPPGPPVFYLLMIALLLLVWLLCL